MAEEGIGTSQLRLLMRWWLTAAALALVVFVILATAYLLIPELAVARGFSYETYRDATGLELGVEDQHSRADAGSGGGWMGPVPLDDKRRYVLVVAPWHGSSDDAISAWAVFDAEQEKIVGSLRVPPGRREYLGIETRLTATGPEPFAADRSGVLWSVCCESRLPAWWPGRGRWGAEGSFKRKETLCFDTTTQKWRHTAPAAADEPREIRLRWVNRTLSLPQSGDELVAEHGFDNDEQYTPIFRRLARRHRESGEVRWQLGPDVFPPLGSPASVTQIMLPSCPLDNDSAWCVLVQCGIEARWAMNEAFWQVDLATGSIARLIVPVPSTPLFPEVASDGQTLVFHDDAQIRTVWPDGSGGSSKVSESHPTGLKAWHAERGLNMLPASGSHPFFVVLPRRRVLVADETGGLIGPRLRVFPVDGGEPREVFPQ